MAVAASIGALLLLAIALAAFLVPTTRRAAVAQLPDAWRITLSAWRHGVRVDTDVVVTMPDGVRLRANLYLPNDSSGPLATVLVRLPYHRLRYDEAHRHGIFFARNGYAVLAQDLRGTGGSEGELQPWRDAQADGVATLDWIVRQPWSNGKVGTVGCSALGEVQFVMAKARHPAHRAIIASGAGGAVGSAAGRYAYFGLFEGGVFQLASGFGWFVHNGEGNRAPAPPARFDFDRHIRRLPVSGLVKELRSGYDGFSAFLAAPLGSSEWEKRGFLGDDDRISAPALVINTWGDQTVGDSLAIAEAWRIADPAGASRHKVVIGPGNHCGHGEVEAPVTFGELPVEDAARPYRDWYLRWFDLWLRGKGDGLRDLPAYQFFMVGENRWASADSWPPAQARIERWYLGGGGHANSRTGNGALERSPGSAAGSDSYDYDPMNPVPTRGGPMCCTGNPEEVAGPADQADVESRDDVLVFTSAPLQEHLRIAGPLKARLSMASSVRDTDLVARLVHVRPDGRATGIQEGALRLRYRDGFSAPSLMEPGRRYDVAVDMRSIAYTIPRGHRMRLHVTSSSFPRLERNLNTGAPLNADETVGVVARNSVFHGPGASSWLELPVLPGSP